MEIADKIAIQKLNYRYALHIGSSADTKALGLTQNK
jgi:hypothetical protein